MDQSVIAGRRWLPITNSMRLRQEEADRLAEKQPAAAAVTVPDAPEAAPVAATPLLEAAARPIAQHVEAWTMPVESWLQPTSPEPVAEVAPAVAVAPVEDWIAQAVAAQPVAVVEAAPVEAVAAPAPDVAAEMAALRDRVAYFESFEQLITDNVQRSGELFRALYAEREKIRSEAARNSEEIAAAATLEAERLLANERQRSQATLMSLMDEASRMQRQIDALIQKIAEGITESTVRMPESIG